MHWDAVAQRGNTLVFLMTTRQLRANMDKLLAHGVRAGYAGGGDPLGHRRRAADRGRHGARRSPTSPPDGAAAAAGHRRSSARSCACARQLRWFERKPLFGRRIVVTRPRAQAAEFIEALAAAGADVVPCPDHRDRAAGIVGSARRGDRAPRVVRLDRPHQRQRRGHVLRAPARAAARRACAAPRRARGGRVRETAARAGRRAACWSTSCRTSSAPKACGGACAPPASRGQRVLLPRAAAAREILPEQLREAGADVDEVASYRDRAAAAADTRELRELLAARSDRPGHLHQLEHGAPLHRAARWTGAALLRTVAIGCIGPITADTARELGLRSRCSRRTYTIPAFTDGDPGALRRRACGAAGPARPTCRASWRAQQRAGRPRLGEDNR